MNTATHAGTVGILNVGAGDTKLSFDPRNPAERIRAARIVRDMLRRGYALLVEVERDGVKRFERATDFLEDTCEYVIADFDPMAAVDSPAIALKDTAAHGNEHRQAEANPPAGAAEEAAPIQRPSRSRKRAIPADSTRAVSVAPIAGG